MEFFHLSILFPETQLHRFIFIVYFIYLAISMKLGFYKLDSLICWPAIFWCSSYGNSVNTLNLLFGDGFWFFRSIYNNLIVLFGYRTLLNFSQRFDFCNFWKWSLDRRSRYRYWCACWRLPTCCHVLRIGGPYCPFLLAGFSSLLFYRHTCSAIHYTFIIYVAV